MNMFNNIQQPSLAALSALKRAGPKSLYPGYDEMTQEDPNYNDWSTQRPTALGSQAQPEWNSLGTRPGLLSAEDVAPRAPLTDLTGEPGGSSVPQDPQTLNLKYLNAMRNETEDRAFAAQRTGDVNEYGALRGLLSRNQRDIEENPITQQGPEIDAIRNSELEAIQQGFTGGTPQRVPGQDNAWSSVQPIQSPAQQAASVGRGMEMFKANAPLEQQQIASQGRIGEADIKGRADIDIAGKRVEQLQNNFGLIQDFLKQGQGADRKIRSINPTTGALTFQNEPQERPIIPSSLERDLANARRMNFPEQVDQLEGSILNYFDPDVRIAVTAIKNDPQGKNDPWDRLQRDLLMNSPEITPEELGQIRQALSIIRGRDF